MTCHASLKVEQSMLLRPRRALLFMPGDDRRKIEKGIAAAPDCVIMDIEDGVAISQKPAARESIRAGLNELNFGVVEKLVRINGLNTPYYPDDLNATIGGQPDGYVIPKAEYAEQLRDVSARLAAAELANGWQTGRITLIAIIESAKGVVNLREIASADSRLVALVFGAEDLAGDIGAIRTPDLRESAYARGAVVIHAKAFGLQAIDTPFIRLNDDEALTAETQTALEMGYTGKLAIHPRQIAPIQTIFTPDQSDIERAQALIAAFHAHQIEGTGAFRLNDQMVDMPMIRAAEALLARARLAGVLR